MKPITRKIIEQYAQSCVDDMDLETLMNELKEAIEWRMEEMTTEEVRQEIEQSAYSSLLEDK